VEENGPEEKRPGRDSLERISDVRNVFVEQWLSLVKLVLIAGALLFVMIRWA
jgi:hypothetical protein